MRRRRTDKDKLCTSQSAAHVSPGKNSGTSMLMKKEDSSNDVSSTQLSVSSQDDSVEKEAGAAANTVMSLPDEDLKFSNLNATLPSFQKKCSDCVSNDTALHPKSVSSQLSASSQSTGTNETAVSDEMASRLSAEKGSGMPIDGSVKDFMEERFSADFSDVRLHTDNDAGKLSDELNAQAFTVGNDIYFNEGKYSPESYEGKHLLAHELAHTMQQGNSVGRKIQRAPVTDVGPGKAAKGKFDPLIGMYTVAPGDTLGTIATRFGTTVSALLTNNPDITDRNKISVGQKIFMPHLVMPLDPTGMKHSEISYDDYKKKWEAEKGRPITAWEDTQLKKGCVGVSAINTGMKPLDNLTECYDTFEHALKVARDKNSAIKMAGESDKKKAVLFSMRFWSGGKAYTPDAAGKVDMTDYAGRLSSGDAWRPDDASGSDYINFDFGFYEIETGMWWHANHKHDPLGMGPMKVFESSLDYYSKPLLDFDRQIFCVVVKNL